MLPDNCRPISVDDHLWEPPNLWTSRLPSRYLESGPHVVKNADGADAWCYEGRLYTNEVVTGCAGMDIEEFSHDRPLSFDEVRPGAFNPQARLADMDIDGIWGSVSFPTWVRFAGHRFLEGNDRELALLCVRAYNDFVIDEWSAAAPDRLISLAILPLWDPELAAHEVTRVAAMGAKGVAFSENPTTLGLPSIHTHHWDPVFRAIEEADIAMCLHIGSSSKMIESSPDAPYAVHLGLVGVNSMVACADYLFSHVLHDYPKLRVVLSEGGAGWVPYVLERCEYTWERNRYHGGIRTDVRPIELFMRNFWVCMIKDDVAIELRDRISVDRMMWECDYPHSDSLWPNSVAGLKKVLAGLPEHEARAIAEENARRVFKLPV